MELMPNLWRCRLGGPLKAVRGRIEYPAGLSEVDGRDPVDIERELWAQNDLLDLV
jgi:hypothetical protein